MHPMPAPERAAAAALPFALAGAPQRACLLDAIGTALDGVRHRLPRQAAFDAGMSPASMLREHDAVRGWVRELAGALRAAAAAGNDDSPRTVPLGPVAAIGFHRSAYGLTGVHVLAALAAGCPVLARAAPSPSCTELAALIGAAAAASRLPDTVFELVDDESAVLTNGAVRAVICRAGAGALPPLLPAVAELDGTEAAFVLPAALNGRAEYVGARLLAQPGSCPIIVAIDGDGYVDLREAIMATLHDTGGTCAARPGGLPLPHDSGARMLGEQDGPAPPFAEVSAARVLAQPRLAGEREGGLLVRCADAAELLGLAWSLGPLACASVHGAPEDAPLRDRLLPVLELGARHIHMNRFGGALLPSRAAARDAIGRFRRPVWHHADAADTGAPGAGTRGT